MKIHATGQHQIEKQESNRFRFWSYATVVPSTVSSTQCTINTGTLKNWPYKNAEGRKQYVQIFRKGVSTAFARERLQLNTYRWQGCWLAILRIPSHKALKKHSFISRDSVGGSLLQGVGWHKGSWKMQMSSFIRWGAGADCWLADPSCETLHVAVCMTLHSEAAGV